MTTPHSLLSACKLVAELAGMPWARVQPIYRALQQGNLGEPLLPLSRGRAICLAEPKYVARFLMAIALTDDANRAVEQVQTFARFSRQRGYKEASVPVAGPMLPDTVEDAIAEAMVEGLQGWVDDPANPGNSPSKGLSVVVFMPDEDPQIVKVGYWGMALPGHLAFRCPRGEDRPEIVQRHIRREITIDGTLIHKISREVVWGPSSQTEA